MTKRELKAIAFRQNLIKSMSLDLILKELERRGLVVSVKSSDGVASATLQGMENENGTR